MDKHESPGQRARRLLEGATPGPWTTEPVPNRQWRAPQWALIGGRRSEALPYHTDGDTEREIVVWVEGSQTHPPHAPDLALIAAAPDLARDLIAAEERVAALEAVVGRVRPVVDELAWMVGTMPMTPLAEMMLRLGRRSSALTEDAAWLRSLLSTGPDPAPQPEPLAEYEPDESERCATTFCARRAGHDGAHSDRCGTRWETGPQPAPASDGPFAVHSAWRFE